MTRDTSLTEPQRKRSSRAFIAAAIAALLLGGTIAATGPADPAQAGVKGFGYQGGSGAGGGWLGSIETSSTSNQFGFCIDPYGFFPSGTTSSGGIITSITGTTAATHPGHNGTRNIPAGDSMRKLNYALSTYGPSANTNVKAAALAAYVYSITSSDHNGDGVYYFIDIRVPLAADREAVKARYQVIKAAANTNFQKALGGRSATLDIVMDTAPALTGHVNVIAKPATSTGVLTLTGAYVAGTTDTTIDVVNGDVVEIEAIPTPMGEHLYEVEANATFTAPTWYDSNVRLYNTTNTYAQRVIRAGNIGNGTFSARAAVADPLAGEFEPVLETVVENAHVAPGEPFIDILTASAVDDVNFPWRQNTSGDYAPIIATGTLYGPFASPPVQSSTVPAGAPVVGTESVTLNGPGEYSTSGSLTATASGYYTWVWTIDRAAQPGFIQALLPAGYLWVDDFGRAEETAVAQASVGISTQVSDDEVGLWQPTTDSVTITHDSSTGEWFLDDAGDPVPLELEGTAYWIPGTTAPTLAAEPPVGAEILDTATLSVTAPGTYPVPAVTPTAVEAGYIVWVWRVASTSLDFAELIEQFGEPTQMVRVVPPALATEATTTVPFGDIATDTAIVTGEATGQAMELAFAAYLQPTAGPAVCDVSNESFSTAATPLTFTTPGRYTSAGAVLPLGTHFWVATLSAADGTVIAQGTCGDPDEITLVADFALATTATRNVVLPLSASDTATVTGPTPTGATIGFEAFKQTVGSDGKVATPTCTPTTRAFTSPRLAVTGPGTYTSASHEFAEAGTYFWVATVYNSAGGVLKAGLCGDPSEVTVAVVLPPALATTGVAFGLWLIAVPIMLIIGALLVLKRRRREGGLQAA